MSTRSQLRFIQRVEQTSETDGNVDYADFAGQMYRHSDTYRAEGGPGYTAATFVFLDTPTEGTAKVSGHAAFPRRDGPINEAVERASGQFHGPRPMCSQSSAPSRWRAADGATR